MRLEYQILAAFVLDFLLGDPRWLPHPVKLIGRFALALETPCRKAIGNPRVAGIVVVLLVVGLTGGATFLLVWGARFLHPLAGDAVSVLLLYTTLATRDLADHAGQVLQKLKAGDLAGARQCVGCLVGRDTGSLDETQVVRATVESVAENLVDGVTAPLFFAVLGGPVGAMAYKAINTLDSTFGYKDERYLEFGWASARLDDLANYLPARLTVPLIALVAPLLGGSPVRSLKILTRDGRKHPSPNSGLSEAAVAGALGVQLGGVNYYGGEPHEGALIGDPVEPLAPRHIQKANRFLMVTAGLATLIFVAIRWWIVSI